MKKGIAFLLATLMLLAMVPAVAEEQVTIRINTCIVFSDLRDRPMIEEQLNRQLAEKGYDFKVEIVPFDYGNYAQLVKLAVSDGSVDIFNMFGAIPLSVAADEESIAPLDDLLNEYGQETLALIEPMIDTVKVNGTIYACPAIGKISKRNNFLYNNEMAKEAGFIAENVVDYDTLTTELLKVKAKYPEMAMISTGFGGMWFWPNMDTLGNDNFYACLMLEENAEAKVVNYYETEMYKADIARAKVWGDNGFFVKDAINGQNAPMALLGQNLSFGCFTDNVGPADVLETSASSYNFEIGCVTAEDAAWATTVTAGGYAWCITEMSEHKEEAMQFLNLLFTDADISNTMINGIEGVHYNLLENGSWEYASPDITSSNVGWASPGGFMPNSWIAAPKAPLTIESYERYAEGNAAALKSPGFGFLFNAVEVNDQIAACNNVCSKYLAPLMLGMGDEAMYEEFISELKRNGVDDIIAEKQAQLDAWLANQ
jgi:putative aldouronate transport system substrate-binding protein